METVLVFKGLLGLVLLGFLVNRVWGDYKSPEEEVAQRHRRLLEDDSLRRAMEASAAKESPEQLERREKSRIDAAWARRNR